MTFDAVIRTATDAAYKFDLLMPDKSFKQLWVPKSVCKSVTKFPPETGRLQQAIVVIEDWWCGKNGL